MSKEKYGVHIAHCCYIHGCKYGDEDCPVVSGEVAQKYLCYDCDGEDKPYTLEEIELLRKTKSYRPTYEQLKNKIADLETKLAEKDGAEQSKYQNVLELTKMCTEKDKKIEQLKQQLAEKNKQLRAKIGNMKSTDFIKMCISCGFWVDAKVVDNQDKISFALDKLVDVQKYIDDNAVYIEEMNFGREIKDFIDNQIKQLREMK